MSATVTDESWPMIERSRLPAVRPAMQARVQTSTPWSVLRSPISGGRISKRSNPIEACELLFRAQGRSLAHTD